MPIDSITRLRESRGDYLQQDASARMNWDSLRQRVMSIGMRNSNTMAIAPTATISNIDRKSTRLNSSHSQQSRMPSSA